MASSEKFIPLTPGQPLPGGTDGFRAGISPVTATAARPAFQPLTSGAPAPAANPVIQVHSHAPDPTGRPPVVTLKREGDRVIGIHIECSCGQIIDLACS